MQESLLKQNTREFQFSFQEDTTEKETFFHDADSMHSDAYKFFRQKIKLPIFSGVTKMVPCPPCTWG
jgi:hypothetical protein